MCSSLDWGKIIVKIEGKIYEGKSEVRRFGESYII